MRLIYSGTDCPSLTDDEQRAAREAAERVLAGAEPAAARLAHMRAIQAAPGADTLWSRAEAAAIAAATAAWARVPESLTLEGPPPPDGALAYKYADPTDGGRWIYEAPELAEIRREDPGLLVIVEQPAPTLELWIVTDGIACREADYRGDRSAINGTDAVRVIAEDEQSALAIARAYDSGQATWDNHMLDGQIVVAVSMVQ